MVTGAALVVAGLVLLWLGWRASEADPRSTTAVPLGVTGGVVALGGLAVLVGGWDAIGRITALVTVVVLVVGLLLAAARRSGRSD